MNRLRVFLALCVLVISAATAAGCGGVPGDSAATVDGEPIEMQSLDHWMTVAAKTNGQPNAQVPKPPHYAPCIEQKRKTQPKPGKGDSKPTDTQLKRHCAQEYEGLRNQALQLLISYRWTEGEARDRRISVTDSEVRKSFEQQRKQSFPEHADHEKFLKDSGQTAKDVLFRVRLTSLSNKIRDQVTEGKDRVTDRQIADCYEKNKERFAQREQRHLRIVMTKPKASAERAKAALAAGRSWRNVARRSSVDRPSRSEGDKMHGVVEGQQETRSKRRSLPPPRARSSARSRHSSAITSSMWTGSRPTRSRRSKRPSPRSSSSSLGEPAARGRRLRQGLPQEVEGEDRVPRGL